MELVNQPTALDLLQDDEVRLFGARVIWNGAELGWTRIQDGWCLSGTVAIQLVRLPVLPDRPSHADPRTAFYLKTIEFSASVGTIYAVSLCEWLRVASLVPATAGGQSRKFVLKRLDEEARS